jgi:hypothetical protein
MEPWRRSDLYARPSPPRACDPIELDRTIATLLLRVDLLTVTSTDDRPDAINLRRCAGQLPRTRPVIMTQRPGNPSG